MPTPPQRGLLGDLKFVMDAMHDARRSGMSTIRNACTEGTRQSILGELLIWAMNPNDKRIFWLNGMAGTGKTTIAFSFCEALRKLGILGATFFCSRNVADCSTVENIPPSIAYQLALYSAQIMDALTSVLDSNHGRPCQNLDVLFDRMLVKPLKNDPAQFAKAPPIIVIDALDECSDAKQAEEFVRSLWAHTGSLPVKFFVTSRPEPHFHGIVYGNDDSSLRRFHLHNVENSLVREDIRLFVHQELGRLGNEGTGKWTSLLKKLVDNAGCLFIYAATASRYVIESPPDPDSQTERLEEIILQEPDSEGTSAVDGIYKVILDASFKKYGAKKEVMALGRILQAIVCLQDPLSIRDLASFIELGENRIRGLLSGFHSVLLIPGDQQHGPIQILHGSFPDYLLKSRYLESRSLDSTRPRIHAALAESSFRIMNEQLRFNVTNFPSSYHANNSISTYRFSEFIGAPLVYASRFWANHLQQAQAAHLAISTSVVEKFAKGKILFWIEVLSVLQTISTANPSLAALINFKCITVRSFFRVVK